MLHNLTIRPAILEEESLIIALWRNCNLVTSYNDPQQDFRFARDKPNSNVLVGLTPEGNLIGSVMVGHDGHRGWVYYVATDPKYRNQGVGSTMMEAAEKWLKEKGIVKLMLMVRETNIQATEFYRRVGFEQVPNVVMQKWLKG